MIRNAIIGAAMLGALSTGTAFATSSVEPRPNGPIYSGSPGALPPGFVYRYNDPGHSWPVRPVHKQHPIRGSFLDPRGPDNDGLGGYHFGVDINVDDRHPDAGAPAGLSHRVYALESGVVSEPVNDPKRSCGNRRLDIGHFAYWHTSPTVHVLQRVRVGQQIGWTCSGEWHVHVSEWQIFRGVRVWVNPLHHGGKLVPFVDSLAPLVSDLSFHTRPTAPWAPTVDLAQPDTSLRLPATRLRGAVEVRARIEDPQSFLGFLRRKPSWAAFHHPYLVSIEIRTATGRIVLRRISFRSDQLPQTPYLVHYAPGTSQNASIAECVGPPSATDCGGRFWFRPLSRFRQEFWDTRSGPNGKYTVIVRAADLAGNVGERRQTVIVSN